MDVYCELLDKRWGAPIISQKCPEKIDHAETISLQEELCVSLQEGSSVVAAPCVCSNAGTSARRMQACLTSATPSSSLGSAGSPIQEMDFTMLYENENGFCDGGTAVGGGESVQAPDDVYDVGGDDLDEITGFRGSEDGSAFNDVNTFKNDGGVVNDVDVHGVSEAINVGGAGVCNLSPGEMPPSSPLYLLRGGSAIPHGVGGGGDFYDGEEGGRDWSERAREGNDGNRNDNFRMKELLSNRSSMSNPIATMLMSQRTPSKEFLRGGRSPVEMERCPNSGGSRKRKITQPIFIRLDESDVCNRGENGSNGDNNVAELPAAQFSNSSLNRNYLPTRCSFGTPPKSTRPKSFRRNVIHATNAVLGGGGNLFVPADVGEDRKGSGASEGMYAEGRGRLGGSVFMGDVGRGGRVMDRGFGGVGAAGVNAECEYICVVVFFSFFFFFNDKVAKT